MGCPPEVIIGDNLTFGITTHDPDTGVVTDADAVPTYLLYEDGNETAILSGNVDDGTGAANQEFDDANTTGFYVKTIACTAANGFEDGKTYTIYITAIVASDEGGFTCAFKAVAGWATAAKLDRNADLAASERGWHTWQGNVFYVAPTNGNDSTGDGTRALPYATIQAAHDDLVTDSNHDVIILLADHASTATTHDSGAATTTISKRYCFIRGPGRDFICTRTGNGPTFLVTADGVEFSGMQIAAPGASALSIGITIMTADFVRVHHVWFLDTNGDGIHCERSSNCQFTHNHFEGTGATSGVGIHISAAGGAGNADDNAIEYNHFADTGGTSILVDGGVSDDTTIAYNVVHDAGAWGIDVSANNTKTLIFCNVMGNNASGNIQSANATSIIRNNTEWTSPTVPTTGLNAQRTIDVTSTGAAGIDWANVENQGTTVDLAATTVNLVNTTTTNTDMRGTDGANTTVPDAAGTAAGLHATTDAAIAAVAADLPSKPTKNVALANFPFVMVLTSDHVTGATGLTVVCQRSIDGGAFEDCANTPATEMANGWYKITLAAPDMNGDTIALKFTATTADSRSITITTQPT